MSTEHNPEPRQSDFPYPFVAHITPDAGKAEAHEICGNLHCPAAHVTHYQGEHPSCAAKLSETPAQQPAQEPCLTCEGHGIIGGYEGSGNDMSPVGYPCPDCNPPAQQPAEAEADIIDHDWQLLSGARVQCAKCGHLTRASDLAMLSSACTGKAQPASEGQQPAEAMPETETPETDAAQFFSYSEDIEGNETAQLVTAASFTKDLERRLTAALAEVERVKIQIEVGHIASLNLKTAEQECQRLTDELSTERAAREQAEKECERLKNNWEEAAEGQNENWRVILSLREQIAESESREHQAREALDIARKTIADFEDDIPLLDSECVEHIREAVNAIESALTAPTSTTVADLRKRAETAERERDAAVKDTKRLDWLENTKAECYSVEGKEQAEGSKLWKIAGKNGFHVTLRAAIDAAIATTQETK